MTKISEKLKKQGDYFSKAAFHLQASLLQIKFFTVIF